MDEIAYREVVTINGSNVVLERPGSPVEKVHAAEGADRFCHVDIDDKRLRPENYSKADGTPLRLFDGAGVKIDLSKRSHENMGFWHRNVDYHEVIICFRGALCWETELGVVTLREGEMIVIPKGITHRSLLCDDSAAENILIELKVSEELSYVGPPKNRAPAAGQ